MKQILQNLRSGETQVAEIPCPVVRPGCLLIQTQRSLVSAGTERMLVNFGQASYFEKARQQPEKVKQVLSKVKTDGLFSTIDAVQSKLDQPLPLGYCNAGVVLEVGAGVSGFEAGDRVISNGAHAEVVCVPENLCAKIPEGVSFESAAFTVAAAIGLQGVRLIEPTLGERFVVTGLGLLGLMTVQILRAHGCEVLGLDFDPERLALARQFGAQIVDLKAGEDPIGAALAFSRGRGVDGVIITASTKSSEPVHQAATMCRKRGRIVLVGVTGLQLDRGDFYQKEISFQVSCSYGPGRYEENFEGRGLDYPIGFVRWTEQRNFEAILDLLASGKLEVEPLVSRRYPVEKATDAYAALTGADAGVGIMLEYPQPDTDPRHMKTVSLGSDVSRTVLSTATDAAKRVRAAVTSSSHDRSKVCVGVIGAGNYASRVMLPALQKTGATLDTIVSQGGMSGYHSGKKFGFHKTSTDTQALFTDPKINTLLVLTRHDNHASLVTQALAAGKHVFVEKPLAINAEQLAEVERVYAAAQSGGAGPQVMVGFNRRFAPQAVELKRLLDASRAPKAMVMTVNAGAIPADHWTQDLQVGGGRIVGEACHFVDLLRFMTGSAIVDVKSLELGDGGRVGAPRDSATITLTFADGSIGTIHYFANGDASFPKERLEVFCGGGILRLDNFRKLEGFGWKGFSPQKSLSQDKGHASCIDAFVNAVGAGAPSPISFDQLIEVSRVSLLAAGLSDQ